MWCLTPTKWENTGKRHVKTMYMSRTLETCSPKAETRTSPTYLPVFEAAKRKMPPNMASLRYPAKRSKVPHYGICRHLPKKRHRFVESAQPKLKFTWSAWLKVEDTYTVRSLRCTWHLPWREQKGLALQALHSTNSGTLVKNSRASGPAEFPVVSSSFSDQCQWQLDHGTIAAHLIYCLYTFWRETSRSSCSRYLGVRHGKRDDCGEWHLQNLEGASVITNKILR